MDGSVEISKFLQLDSMSSPPAAAGGHNGRLYVDNTGTLYFRSGLGVESFLAPYA